MNVIKVEQCVKSREHFGGIDLPNRWRHNQSDKQQTYGNHRMRRWHFENVFQEECIQFGYLPENNHLRDRNKAHICGLRMKPAHR